MVIKDKVKQRRLERLRHLRESSSEVSSGNGSSLRSSPSADFLLPPHPPHPSHQRGDVPLYVDSEWKRRMEDPEYAWRQKLMMDTANDDAERNLFTPPSARRIAMKLLISGVIFVSVYGLFQIDKPWANQGKLFITAALTQSYDFTAFSAWYSDKFGGAPSFIPSFNRAGNEAVIVSTSNRTLFAPAKGTVMIRYDGTLHKGVHINTAEFAPVYAMDTGQVIFAGNAADTGLTIMIRHPGGLESLYGGLSQTSVTVGDWMKVGEPIGKASAKDPAKGTLYFSVMKEGVTINPAEVITFD
ncbi:M23 family metallopeptidase [Paenibacillus qinlingensis]|uniref:Stage IV sporulation protein FA n=1 Tax=Paenibacillus qinlingensis TaxID=1837343 RepID=A0ABU1P7U8_9BACL|nr:M23 family metallopeptidase [Paenibacillus qinlingensis]MDR6555659.1 stage IV sporulation protein FA [Paenibacillus qinlingensis]